jgi:hypothetical protein
MEFPPTNGVVTTVSVPQEAPLQPGPVSDQASVVLGLEFATGVNVATIVAVAPAGTPDGAVSWSEKLLVMVSAAEVCFEESATLCAVSVTFAGEGRIPGAVKCPPPSTLPQALGHAAPERLQRTAVSGCPLLVTPAWKACVAPSSTLASFGVSASAMSLVMLTLADLDFVVSAWLVAVTCTAAVAGRSAGAV